MIIIDDGWNQFVIKKMAGADATNRKGTWMGKDPMYDIFFDPDGNVISNGTLFSRPEYARTLQLIAENGSDVFYNGEIGEGVVKAVRATGGFMTMEDLNGTTSAV